MQISEPWPSLSSHRRPSVPHAAASAALSSSAVGRPAELMSCPSSCAAVGPVQWKSFLYSTVSGILSATAGPDAAAAAAGVRTFFFFLPCPCSAKD